MRIAIVNDTAMVVEVLKRAIVSNGHEVAWVGATGEAAVENCARDAPDLVLMDLFMPVMDGVEATRRIMASSPCAILIVTSSVRDHSAKVFAALGLGALDAVATPVLLADGSGGEALLNSIDTIGKLLRYQTRPVDGRVRTATDILPDSNPSALVVIGASAGGPKALTTVLQGMPADFRGGIAIVQHLDAEFAESLAVWLTEHSGFPVKIARPGLVVKPGTAWLAGTGRHLVMTSDGRLNYQTEPTHSPYRPCIDVFFETVAQYWRGSLVAAVLTGMGRDGAAGLVKLRARGFHTIAQDEATSAVYGMPRAAYEGGGAVERLPLGEIATALVRRVELREGLMTVPLGGDGGKLPVPAGIDAIETYLTQTLGFKPGALGPHVVQRAATTRMAALGIVSPADYLVALHATLELSELIELLVNAETWFFREPRVFPDIVKLVQERVGHPVRLLSLPCSTGEEPYSLAMSLLDHGVDADAFHIDAIDISRQALALAERGVFGKSSFRGTNLGFRGRHFQSREEAWEIDPAIRRTVHFMRANALEGVGRTGVYDVIVCRNLMIYLTGTARTRLFEVLHVALAPDGHLVLSSSEGNLAPRHRFQSHLSTIFRKAGSAPQRPDPRLLPRPPAPSPRSARPPASPAPAEPAAARREPALPVPVGRTPVPLGGGGGKTPAEAELASILDLANQGRYQQAETRCQDVLKRFGPSAQVFYLIGLVHGAQGRDQEAVECLRRALYLDPQHPEAHMLLALTRQRVRQRSGA